MKKLPTPLILGAAATGAAGTAGLAYYGNHALTVSCRDLSYPMLPPAFDGLRLLHLSDLHAARFGKNQKVLLRRIEQLSPDIVMITGDLIDRRRTRDNCGMRPALTLLRELAKRFPTVRVDGNHEVASPVREEFTRLAAQTGVQNVTGRALTVRRGADFLTVIGIPDVRTFDNREETWQHALHTLCAPHESSFCIALSHRPQFFASYVRERLPLVLCGHAHGGQVRLPLVGGLYAPEQGVLPRYTAGCHTQQDTDMVVSRGLGNSGFPMRFCNHPELVLLTLHCGVRL